MGVQLSRAAILDEVIGSVVLSCCGKMTVRQMIGSTGVREVVAALAAHMPSPHNSNPSQGDKAEGN